MSQRWKDEAIRAGDTMNNKSRGRPHPDSWAATGVNDNLSAGPRYILREADSIQYQLHEAFQWPAV